MNRFARLPRDWSRDRILLIIGPVVLSGLLIAMYAAGVLPLGWPALLMVLVVINLAGDIAYAVKNERSVRHSRASLCNEIVGSRAIAENGFARDGGFCRGMVVLAGERWQAVSNRRIHAGEPLRVKGRRGLVLDVVPERNGA